MVQVITGCADRNSIAAGTLAVVMLSSCHGTQTIATTPPPVVGTSFETEHVDGGAAVQGAEAAPEHSQGATEEPSPDRPLTLAEAQDIPHGQHFQLAAWLWSHPAPCPDCPEGAQCEPCLPPHSSFGDRQQRCAALPCHSTYVDYHHNFDETEVGTLFVIVGRWLFSNHVGYLFTAEAMTPVTVDIEPSTEPVPPSAFDSLSAPWRCERTLDCEDRLLRFCNDGPGTGHCRESAFEGQERLCTVSCGGSSQIP